MSEVALLDAAHVNPAAAPTGIASADADASRAMDILDGDEIIQLSIKPSLWYVPLASANMVAAMSMIAAVAAAVGTSLDWSPMVLLVFQLAVVCAVVRVAYASLQWASRLYLLTNRRVMIFRGVLSVSVTQLRLDRIAEADLCPEWYERPIGLGTVRLKPLSEAEESLNWTYLARPGEVHEVLVRAIRRSRRGS